MHDEMMKLLHSAEKEGFKNEFMEFFYLIMSYKEEDSRVHTNSIEAHAVYAYRQMKQKYSPAATSEQ